MIDTKPMTIYESFINLEEATWIGRLSVGGEILGEGEWHFHNSVFDATNRDHDKYEEELKTIKDTYSTVDITDRTDDTT